MVDGDLPSLAVDEAVGAEHLLDDAVGPTVGRVGPVDTPNRINWLASQSTQARLQHTIDLCEEFLRARAQADGSGSDGDSG